MKIFDNGILCLTEVHGVVTKPRDLTKEQFDLLCWFTNTTYKNIIECRTTSTVALESGLLESLSDVRRAIKGNAFGVGKRKITDFDDELSEDEFYSTGRDDMRWTTIKNGKKKNEIIVILRDDDIADPWFGVSYADWHADWFFKNKK